MFEAGNTFGVGTTFETATFEAGDMFAADMFAADNMFGAGNVFEASSTLFSSELLSFSTEQSIPAPQDPALLGYRPYSPSAQGTDDDQSMQIAIDPMLGCVDAADLDFTMCDWSDSFGPMHPSAQQQQDYSPTRAAAGLVVSDLTANTAQMTPSLVPHDPNTPQVDLATWPWLDQSDSTYQPATDENRLSSPAVQCDCLGLLARIEKLDRRMALMEESARDAQWRLVAWMIT
jgi:hypothetical protein